MTVPIQLFGGPDDGQCYDLDHPSPPTYFDMCDVGLRYRDRYWLTNRISEGGDLIYEHESLVKEDAR